MPAACCYSKKRLSVHKRSRLRVSGEEMTIFNHDILFIFGGIMF